MDPHRRRSLTSWWFAVGCPILMTAGTYPPPLILTEKDSLSLRVGESEMFSVQLADVLP
jgi:hypothetical protein